MAYVVTADSGLTTTRKQIRQQVGRLLGDLVILTATANGTTTTFLDTNHLVLPNNEYKGRTLWFTSGSNAGIMRRVTSSTQSSGTIGWSGAVTATATNDTAELWNKAGAGWEPDEINDLIAVAHREAFMHLPVVAIAEESDEFDMLDPLIAVPTEFRAVSGVQWMDGNGDWRNVERAKRSGAPGYWVEKADRAISISEPWRHAMHGMLYRVRGYMAEEPFEDDDDETVLNPEWLVARTCELACMAALTRTNDPGIIREKAAIYRNEVQMKRTLMIGRREGTVDKVG